MSSDIARSSSVDENGHLCALKIYLSEIRRMTLLTRQEEIDLAVRMKDGDRVARELMITSNLLLVVKIARNYEGIGLSLLELIQEGNIGLMKAIERFDPTKEVRVSTYASVWIMQAIKHALTKWSKMIRLPASMLGKITRMSRVIDSLCQTLGREPQIHEIAFALGIKECKVREMQAINIRPISLDLVSRNSETNIGEMIADTHCVDPADHAIRQSDLSRLATFMSCLSPLEQRIIRLRYGLDNGGEEMTCDGIGMIHSVSGEWIRQIEQLCLLKLRSMMMGTAYVRPRRKKKRSMSHVRV